jgi:hypothetical protein
MIIMIQPLRTLLSDLFRFRINSKAFNHTENFKVFFDGAGGGGGRLIIRPLFLDYVRFLAGKRKYNLATAQRREILISGRYTQWRKCIVQLKFPYFYNAKLNHECRALHNKSNVIASVTETSPLAWSVARGGWFTNAAALITFKIAVVRLYHHLLSPYSYQIIPCTVTSFGFLYMW